MSTGRQPFSIELKNYFAKPEQKYKTEYPQWSRNILCDAFVLMKWNFMARFRVTFGYSFLRCVCVYYLLNEMNE